MKVAEQPPSCYPVCLAAAGGTEDDYCAVTQGVCARKAQQEPLADILRAEVADQDLHDGGHCIHVCAMKQDRTLYEIGRVSAALVYQRPDAARAAIEHIKFSGSKT